MIDTGSTENAVLPAIADQLYLSKGSGGVANGIGGHKAFTYRNAESLSIGGLVLNGNQLAALDLHWFTSSFGGMVSGIIGFHAFGQVPLTIDYQKSLLTVHHPDHFQPPSGAKAYRLWSYRGLPMIRVVVGQKHEAWLIVDTGAETHITLPMACAVTWPDIVMVPTTSPGRARGVGGSVSTVHTWLTSIRLLGLDLRRTPVSFEAQASTPQRPHMLPIGRIGNQLLRHFHLTFDPKNNRLWVRWRGDDQPPPKST